MSRLQVGTTATETYYMLETVYGHETVSCTCVLNGLNDSESGMGTMKKIHRMGGHQLSGIHEHLQQFITWWPEIIKLPLN